MLLIAAFVAPIAYVSHRVKPRPAPPPEPISALVADHLARGVQFRALAVAAAIAIPAALAPDAEARYLLGALAGEAMLFFIAATRLRRLSSRPGVTAAVRGRHVVMKVHRRELSLPVSRRMIAAARRKALPEARAT